MKMPILMQGQSMTPAGTIQPMSMSQSWKEDGESTATITMAKEGPEIPLGAWIHVFAPNGAMDAMMYVKTRKTDYTTGIRTYTLQHVFHLLEEMIVFGEIAPADMGGSETSVAANTAIAYLLNRQTTALFTMGTSDFTDAQGWKFQNSNIFNDLQSITEAIEDCEWQFGFDTFPWTLSLKQKATAASMEMRMSRNLSTITIQIDRSRMYTRAYPVGKNDLHITGDYLERNTSIYGVIGQVISESSIEDETLLTAWAEKQLKKNAEPTVNVSIAGWELSQDTGVSWDQFITGKVCRVPLPEYSTTIMERIIEVSWKNCMLDEESCSVTMANEKKTVHGVLNDIASGGGAGSSKSHMAAGCSLRDHEDRIEDEEDIISQAGMYLDDYGVIQYSTNTETSIGSRMVSLNNRADMAVGKYKVDVKKLTEYGSKAAFPATGAEGYFYGDASTNRVYTWKTDSNQAAGGYYVPLTLEGDAKLIGYGSRSSFPATGEQGYYYGDASTGKTYVWDATKNQYVESDLGDHSAGYYVKTAEISTYINEAGESVAHINGDHVNISATQSIHMLTDSFQYDANGKLVMKSSGGVVVERTEQGITAQYGVFDNGTLTGGVCVEKINGAGTITKIRGDRVTLGTDQDSAVTIQGYLDSDTDGLLVKTGLIVNTGHLLYARGGIVVGGVLDIDDTGGLAGVSSIEYDNDVFQLVANVEVDSDDTNQLNIQYTDGTTATYSPTVSDIGGETVAWQTATATKINSVTSEKKKLKLSDNTEWETWVVTEISRDSVTINYLGHT